MQRLAGPPACAPCAPSHRARGGAGGWFNTQTDRDGRFSFQGVAEARCQILTWGTGGRQTPIGKAFNAPKDDLRLVYDAPKIVMLRGTVVAFDESPRVEGLLYSGSDDGMIQVREPGGEWRRQAPEKTPGLMDHEGLSELAYVADLVASRHADDRAGKHARQRQWRNVMECCLNAACPHG